MTGGHLARHRRDVERFDEWAASYDEHWLQQLLFRRVHRVVVDTALRFAPDTAAVLDVGSGTGLLLRELRSAFPLARLLGVDAAAGMVETAQRSASDIEFVQGEAETLPAPDAAFDLVTTTLSFHHWHDQREGLREVRRTLRPGGLFLLSDLVLEPWMVPFAVLARARQRTHPLGEFRMMLVDAGFTPVRAIAVPRLSHAVYVMATRR